MGIAIYTIIKVAREVAGEFVMVATEKAFVEKANAEKYLTTVSIVWEEKVSGFHCQCERGIHEVVLEE